MKIAGIIIMLGLLVVSCGHRKKDKKTSYSPMISFREGEVEFVAKVQLPREFKEKIPLVVVIHEWWGRTPYIQQRANMLNKEGHASLAVDLYGDGKIVETPSEAQALAHPFYQNPQLGVDRLKKYIEMAKQDPHIDPSRIYVIGYCFGGTAALNLARSGADVNGVASFHGGLISTLKPQNVKAKILVLNGLADPMVPAKDRRAFVKEMKKYNVDYKMVNYKNATHAFTNPMATVRGKKFKIPIAYNKEADEESWKELVDFLK